MIKRQLVRWILKLKNPPDDPRIFRKARDLCVYHGIDPVYSKRIAMEATAP